MLDLRLSEQLQQFSWMTPGFYYSGTSAAILTTPIEIGPCGATLGSDSQNGSLEISGTISGTGLVTNRRL
jgi:hypothetical protein